MRTVEFGSLFMFIRNGLNVKQEKSGQGLPISRIETIWAATIDPSRVGYAGLSESDCAGWLLQEGDILFSHINSVEHIGKCAIYEGIPAKLVHGMNLLCLRCDPDKVVPAYARALIQSNGFRARLSNFINKAVNQASVSIGNLKTIQVAVPPLAEQRRIAAILDKAEALRAERRLSLSKLLLFVDSLFTSMFGDNTFPTFPLEDLLKAPLQNGAYFPKECYAEAGTEMVHMSDAFYGTVVRGALRRVLCTREDVEKYGLSEADILVARRSLTYEGAAKPCLIPKGGEPLIFESSFIRVTPEPTKAAVLYLFYYLSNQRVREQQIERFVTQSTISGINQSNLRQLPVTVPPLKLQQEFVERVLSLKKAQQSSLVSLHNLGALFASLQHRAFRGEL